MSYAFISSPVKGLVDIRTELHDLSFTNGRAVYVDEIDHPRPRSEPGFVTLEDLFREIRAAPVFIVLLAAERHGTGLKVGDQVAHVSYWEAELFYAILIGKPVHVVQTDDFRPDPKLAALLTLLQRVLPSSDWHGPTARRELVDAVRRLLDREPALTASPGGHESRILRALVDGFFRLRGKDAPGGAAEHESLQFSESPAVDSTVVPNERVIASLFDEIKTLLDEEGRLTRLWVIFRELSGRPVTDPDFLPHWNRFYTEWATAGSWYGLHSHHYFAVLPGLVEQAKVRMQMRTLGSSAWRDEPTYYPGGPLASARYSIAGLSGSWRNRRRLLRAARADLGRALAEGVQNRANLLAIRGSIHRSMGAIWAAVDDYEGVLSERRADGVGDGPIGEALAELGYGQLFQLRFWRGRSHLEEGVRLLSRSEGRMGFLIRAKRKLAAAYYLTGQPRRARAELSEVNALADKHGVRDQLRR